MKARCRGMALVEIMIIVILISTVATAYWNYYITHDFPSPIERAYSPTDSIANDILDEIALNMRLARPDSAQSRIPVIISKNGKSDQIDIISRDIRYIYYVDQYYNLYRRIGNNRGLLLDDVLSFRVTPMGIHTFVITLQVGQIASEASSTPADYRNYSRVVSINSPFSLELATVDD